MSAMIGDHNVIQDYASRLRQGVEEDAIIREYRRKFQHRFQELCMVHLSFLIDIPWNIVEQCNGNSQEYTPKSALKRWLAGSRVNPQQFKSDATPEHLLNNALQLIDRLDHDQACSAEGIFRKAGHMQRKRQLHEALLLPHFDPETFPWELYTVHDLATALKSLIAHLPSPLLTNRFMPLFLRVAGLLEPETQVMGRSFNTVTTPNRSNVGLSIDEPHWDLIRSKQLKALRLLVQLLPTTNKRLFHRLMMLLERVVRLQSSNRMTSTNLGMVFGPVLFPYELTQDPNNSSKHSRLIASDCHSRCKQLSALVAVLIDASSELFLLPRSLAEDVHTNYAILTELLENAAADTDMENDKSTGVHGSIQRNSLHVSCEPMKPCAGEKPFYSGSSSPISLSSSSPGTTKILKVFQSPGDSPPLHTGIRFATPTMASTSNGTLQYSSPKRINSSPSVIDGIQKRAQSSAQPETPNESSVSRRPLFTNKAQSNSAIPHTAESPSYPITVSIPRIQRRGSFAVSHSTGFLVNSSNSTSIKHSVSIPDLDSPTKRKPGKKRRYTELRLPSSVNRTGPRRHIFSPCPPLGFHPFRRAVVERRSSHDLNVSSHVVEIQPVPIG